MFPFGVQLTLKNQRQLDLAMDFIKRLSEAEAAESAASPTASATAAGAAFQNVAQQNLRLLRDGPIPNQGWSRASNITALIASLPTKTRKVVLRAIENGGQLTRDEVYEVIGRKPDLSLRGFTRPVKRLMEKLTATGAVDTGAVSLLLPIYDDSDSGFQRTQGFMVPLQVVVQFRAESAH